MGEMRKEYNILVGKLEGKRPLGRHRREWEDNIRMDLKETAWEVADWIHLSQGSVQWRALVNMVMNFGFD
jgi:hypothetical protein